MPNGKNKKATKKPEIQYPKLAERFRNAREVKSDRDNETYTYEKMGADFHYVTNPPRWPASKTFSNWCLGYTRPSPEEIEILAQILNVSREEKTLWMGYAGYLAPIATQLPAKEDLVKELEHSWEQRKSVEHPMLLVDYIGTIWALNPAAIAFVGDYDTAIKTISRPSTLIDVVFDDDNPFIRAMISEEEIRALRVRQLSALLRINLSRRHEPFWESLPGWYKNRLGKQEYKEFTELWNKICDDTTLNDGKRDLKQITNSGNFNLALPDKLPTISFKIVPEGTDYFEIDKFQIVNYIPASDATWNLVKDYFSKFERFDHDKLKIWHKDYAANFDAYFASILKSKLP